MIRPVISNYKTDGSIGAKVGYSGSFLTCCSTLRNVYIMDLHAASRSLCRIEFLALIPKKKAMEVKVQIVKTEAIKPSSPTPSDLRSFKLSVVDQINPAIYTPLLLFYPDRHGQLDPDEKSMRLKLSLSRTLTGFYPLAGRIRDNLSIDCIDQGAEFIEAEVNCCLSDILKQPDMVTLERLLPVPANFQGGRDAPLLYIRANFFARGGLVIGVSISHRFADAYTLSTFVNTWSTEARGGSGELFLPDFRLSKLFPPVDLMSSVHTAEPVRKECATRRVVVESSRIESLRARAASDGVPRPTRVEAVAALIWKAAATASRKNSNQAGCGQKKTVLSQLVNLWKRADPPLPDNAVGNMAGFFAVRAEKTELKLQNLVCHLRKGIQDYQRDFVEQVVRERRVRAILEAARDFGELWADKQADHFNCSSWFRFPLYAADFGWGKPVWASRASSVTPNNFIMLSTPDGEGIEVWLPLSKADMALVEGDEELLEFASLDPAVEF